MVTRIRQLSSLVVTGAALSALATFALSTEPVSAPTAARSAEQVTMPGIRQLPLIIWWPPTVNG